MSVYRLYTERRPGFQLEAGELDLGETLGIFPEYVRIFNRYDIEGIDAETYKMARDTILSEPQTDLCFDENLPEITGKFKMFAVEPLPGQYDQRSDSCEQCIQIMTHGERPTVRAAKVYVLGGEISEKQLAEIKAYIINPVERREAALTKPQTLKQEFAVPTEVEILTGFIKMDTNALSALHSERGLAMDMDDLRFLQGYFTGESRDPSLTELKVIDTYWSDHCRHTTFSTIIDSVEIFDSRVAEAYKSYLEARKEVYGDRAETRPVTLMDIATAGVKLLKKRGMLSLIDESEEINACSVKVTATVDGKPEDWVLMFKNETHNHPTEIEPFGGAATCLGGAIRDPLSGRSYVYQAMRVTGASDPTVQISETMAGKLPQKKLTTTAAAGYSSYGNQIGLATGIVDEVYHPGYTAKRMEIGAVVGAAPAKNIRRERPEAGDIIILLGGRTGRDGIGGATGSSKTHTVESLTDCAAEVQKGNPPEERKLQRLFRDPAVSRMIKRCNDFGAGGVCVAIGELADGLEINLDVVPKKYEGLDGTELAISESQERMAVVVEAKDAVKFIAAAGKENLEATVVATVTESPRLKMTWNGKTIVDISREFLNSNGAEKHMRVKISAETGEKKAAHTNLKDLLGDLNVASKRGLVERFDSSIGASSVLMPFGGKTQRTPAQSMAALFPALGGETETCSVMAYGFDPYLSSADPFGGAQAAVVSSVSKLVASGCDYRASYLTLQEYFERLRTEPERWGKPFSALLGAFSAQAALGIAAIGGKDSMSGSFLDIDVPPTLVSFAIAAANASEVISPEFKGANSNVYLIGGGESGDFAAHKAAWDKVFALAASGKVKSAWAVGTGVLAEGIAKMSFGNHVGFAEEGSFDGWYEACVGGIIVETDEILNELLLGRTVAAETVLLGGETLTIGELLSAWESPLEKVFKTETATKGEAPIANGIARAAIVRAEKLAKPLAVIPVFPGTNCEYDTARAVERAGGRAEILLIRNLTPAFLEESSEAFERAVKSAQMIVLPGGFSGGDEPDGSAKFITSFFRNPKITEAVHELLYTRDGLMLGICNGFQALVKLGLLPFGEIRNMDETCPTLTFNEIGRHQSQYVTTRVGSTASPWLSKMSVGDLHAIPISHGEGRFVAPNSALDSLFENGQIAFQYADKNGIPSMSTPFNPNGSMRAIEGIISADGRVLGKMGHTERSGKYVAKNIPVCKNQPLFEGGVGYFAD